MREFDHFFSFHIGSGCRDYSPYIKSLETCKRLIDFAKEIGFVMTLLDIGGGFPGTGGVEVPFEKVRSASNFFL